MINATLQNDSKTLGTLLSTNLSPDLLNKQHFYSLPGDVWGKEINFLYNSVMQGNFTLTAFACYYEYKDIIALFSSNENIDINKSSVLTKFTKYDGPNRKFTFIDINIGPNSRFLNGLNFEFTPLMLCMTNASISKNMSIFDSLISLKNIDVNKTSLGVTPLVFSLIIYAVLGNDYFYKKLVAHKNIDINKPCDDLNGLENIKYTPLMFACETNNSAFVTDLLSNPNIDIYKEIRSPHRNFTHSAFTFARKDHIKHLLLNPPNHPPQPWTMWGIDKNLWTRNAKPHIQSPDAPPLLSKPSLNFPNDAKSLDDVINYFNTVGQPGNIIASSNSFPNTQRHTERGDNVTVNNLDSYSDALDALQKNWNSILNGNYAQKSINDINEKLTKLQIKYDTTIPATHKSDMSILDGQKQSVNGNITAVNKNINSTLDKTTESKIKLEKDKDTGVQLNQTLSSAYARQTYYKDLNTQQLKVFSNEILTQNDIIDNKAKDIQYNRFKKEREGMFIFDKMGNYDYANTILFYLYYVVLVVFIYFYLTVTKSDYRIKIIIIILLGLYPFIINFLEKYIFYALELIYSMMLSKVYKSPKMQYDTSMEKN
jgi:hypothetical protein